MFKKAAVLIVFTLTAAVGLAFWVHLGISTEQHAQKVWRETDAEVIRSDYPNGGMDSYYRVASLHYRDFHSRRRIIHNVSMPRQTHVTDKEPIQVSVDGRLWIKNNLDKSTTDPRHISWSMRIFFGIIAIITSVLAGIVAIFTLRGLITLIAGLLARVWRFFTKPALMQLALRKIKRALGRAYDSIKLRWEFYRRRKRIRTSPAYKLVRRLQTELVRMDPTPTVIAVRRRANTLLTSVLERDNERVEVIEGLIEDLRQEVEEHLETRKQALEEVRNSM